MVQADVTLTKRDIMTARLVVFYRSGFGIAIILLALGLALANYTFLQLGPGSSFLGAVWLPLLLGWLIIPGAVAAAGINGAAVRKVLVPIQYRFDEAGIHVVAPHVTGRFEWSEVRTAYESQRLLVFTTPGALQVIPKRFLSPETFAALKALVRTSLGPRARFKRDFAV